MEQGSRVGGVGGVKRAVRGREGCEEDGRIVNWKHCILGNRLLPAREVPYQDPSHAVCFCLYML